MSDFTQQGEETIRAFESGQIEAREAISHFVAQLKSPEPDARREATERLTYFGREAIDAIAALSMALTDLDAKVRMGALRALRVIAPNSRSLIQPLIKTLKDEVPSIRWTAVEMLGAMGPAASEAIPKLKELLGQDRNIRVHQAAKKSLQQISNYE